MFRDFKRSPAVIRSAVLMYVRHPLSLRDVEDLLFERGIDVSYETVRPWWNRFGPVFALETRRRRAASHCSYIQWRWHLVEVFVRINGATRHLWRAVDHEGEVLKVFVTRRRDCKAAKAFLKRALKRYGRLRTIVADRLRSYGAAMGEIGNAHQPLRRRDRAMTRFRRRGTLQKLAAVHASVHNHFNLDRQTSRTIFKAKCSAALAGWQQLAA